MTDRPIFDHINELSNEEERLWERAADGGGLSTADQERLDDDQDRARPVPTTCSTSARLDAKPASTRTPPRSARPRSSSATSSNQVDVRAYDPKSVSLTSFPSRA